MNIIKSYNVNIHRQSWVLKPDTTTYIIPF